MCTAVIDVGGDGVVRLLAIRDEDPARAWDPLGEWWPDQPGVRGVRDRRAGGAWLAADSARRTLAVALNRHDELPEDGPAPLSRGLLVLDAVAGRLSDTMRRMRGFNLLDIGPTGARVLSWDGRELRETVLGPGVHMVAHDDVDDPDTVRIARWLPEFAARRAAGEEWAQAWLAIVDESAALPPTDDRALVRDNRPWGVPTLSLLYCLAEIGPDTFDLRYAELPEPGAWPAPA
ncbi:hypothetical protein ABCS02_21735 [Microbacterium sp. X-17]|uniref:hypothetical protein n=1 Tax=Microbacterium sp. X-17 TaxID=3144404 RepID=UPI0031F48264